MTYPHGPFGITTVTTTPASPLTATAISLGKTSSWKDRNGVALVVPFNVVIRHKGQYPDYGVAEEVRVTAYNSGGITAMTRAQGGTTAISIQAGDEVYPAMDAALAAALGNWILLSTYAVADGTNQATNIASAVTAAAAQSAGIIVDGYFRTDSDIALPASFIGFQGLGWGTGFYGNAANIISANADPANGTLNISDLTIGLTKTSAAQEGISIHPTHASGGFAPTFAIDNVRVLVQGHASSKGIAWSGTNYGNISRVIVVGHSDGLGTHGTAFYCGGGGTVTLNTSLNQCAVMDCNQGLIATAGTIEGLYLKDHFALNGASWQVDCTGVLYFEFSGCLTNGPFPMRLTDCVVAQVQGELDTDAPGNPVVTVAASAGGTCAKVEIDASIRGLGITASACVLLTAGAGGTLQGVNISGVQESCTKGVDASTGAGTITGVLVEGVNFYSGVTTGVDLTGRSGNTVINNICPAAFVTTFFAGDRTTNTVRHNRGDALDIATLFLPCTEFVATVGTPGAVAVRGTNTQYISASFPNAGSSQLTAMFKVPEDFISVSAWKAQMVSYNGASGGTTVALQIAANRVAVGGDLNSTTGRILVASNVTIAAQDLLSSFSITSTAPTSMAAGDQMWVGLARIIGGADNYTAAYGFVGVALEYVRN